MLTYEFPIEIQTFDELLPLACIILGIPNPGVRFAVGNVVRYRKSMASDLRNLDLNSSLIKNGVSLTLSTWTKRSGVTTIDRMLDEG